MKTTIASARAELALSQPECDLVARRLPLFDLRVEPMTRRYYEHLKTTEIGRLLTEDRTEQLRAARIAHWRLLLKGDFAGVAEDYADRFGRRLFEAGFPRRIFVVATNWFTVEMLAFVAGDDAFPAAEKDMLATAIVKFAFLDLAMAHAAREVAYLD